MPRNQSIEHQGNRIPEQMWVVRATDQFAVLDCASTTLGVVIACADCRSWHPTNAGSLRLLLPLFPRQYKTDSCAHSLYPGLMPTSRTLLNAATGVRTGAYLSAALSGPKTKYFKTNSKRSLDMRNRSPAPQLSQMRLGSGGNIGPDNDSPDNKSIDNSS